ncbi:hypothetical protein Gpo141_00007098 [Globisporangium polare]
MFTVGVCLSIVMPWLSAEKGRIVAVLATILTLPSFVNVLTPVRYDIVVLLIKTYDFWYFMIVNTVACVFLAGHFGDVRGFLVLMPWIGNLSCVLADANTQMVQHMVAKSIPGVIVNSVLIVCVQLRLIDGVKHFAVAEYGGRTLSVEDVVANGLATHLLLLVRNLYRRTQSLKWRDLTNILDSASFKGCVNYRCAIKLQLVSQPSVSALAAQVLRRREPRHQVRSESERSSYVQMVLANETHTFNASNTFISISINSIQWASWKRVALRCVAIVGISLPIVARSEVWTLHQRRSIYCVAVVCTQIVCLLAWALSHKQLFWRIILTFDYFFLSFQLSSLHACACDMISWDVNCLGLFNSWLWMHFVIMADAITPVMRRKIGLNSRFLALPVMLFIVLQVALCYKLLVGDGSEFQDRELFFMIIGSRRIEFRVVPFFFSRLATTFMWSFRLLWRILYATNDEVILLRGQIAYATKARRLHGIAPTGRAKLAVVGGATAILRGDPTS